MQNRKSILDDLQQKKQQLMKQSTGQAGSVPVANPNPMPSSQVGLDAQMSASQQRTALQHAHAHSVGFFITQDSSFGNLILPVIPRLEQAAAVAATANTIKKETSSFS